MIRTISAIQLQNEYETNEINADDKYTDNVSTPKNRTV